MTAHRVVLRRFAVPCPFWKCRAPARPYTHQGSSRGWTVVRYAHTSLCPTRLWGHAVRAGAAFGTCEQLTDKTSPRTSVMGISA